MTASAVRERPPRSNEAWGRGATLALLVHVALVIALAFGVSWRSSEPAGVEAELWATLPQTAAPKVELPQPQPQPPVPAAPPPPPKPVETAPPQPSEAEIALEKARQEKLVRDQQEQLEREQRERREQLEREQRDKREQERREREEELKKQRAEEQKRQQAAEREAERKAAEEEKRREQQRKEQMERMLAQAGGAGGTGSAARSAGPSAGYAGRIIAKVKPNIVFGDDPPGNPSAEVEVRAAADGTIVGRRLVKASGMKDWDEAVLRAIDRTETLPKDVDGRVPPTIVIAFKLRE